MSYEFAYPWLSFTAIKTFGSCNRRFKHKYIDLFKEETTVQMKRGNIVHDSFERFFRDITAQEVLDLVYNDHIAGKIESSLIYRDFISRLRSYMPDDPIMQNSKEKTNIERSLMAFARMETKRIYMLKAVCGDITLATIKAYWFPYKIEEMYADTELQVYGKIDRVQQDPDGKFYLMDYKTTAGKRKKKTPASYESLQARVYMYIFCQQEGIDPKNVEFDFIYINVLPNQVPNILEVKYHKGAETRLKTRITKMRDKIDSGVFPRAVDNCTPEQLPFRYIKVCDWCSFVNECYNIPRSEFSVWAKQKYYERKK